MVTKAQTLIGYSGYRHQLDRARRFLDRVAQMRHDRDSDHSDHDFQDMMWAAFQNCWHVKDWVKNDPNLSEPQKHAVLTMAHASLDLCACADLCNGTKHLRLTSAKTAARHGHIDSVFNAPGGILLGRECIVTDANGDEISGVVLCRRGIEEWERILTSQNLSIRWDSDYSYKFSPD
jgi:hypothetical protein